jgi:putative ABC transport system permease protein
VSRLLPQLPPPLLLRAGLRYQLRHRWQLLLALIGIVTGVAVVLAVDLANQAAKASFAQSATELRGAATHSIVGVDGRVPDSLYRDLATSPGHPPLAPVIEARTRLAADARPLRLVGLDLFAETAFRDRLPSLVQDSASLGDWLSQPGAVVLSSSAAADLGVTVGDPLEVTFEGAVQRLKLFAIGDDDSLASRDLLVVDIATAQAVTGLQGALSRIDAILDADALTWIGERLPSGVRLVEVAAQLSDTAGLSAAFELNLTAMSLLALLVGVFLIFNAISFSIVQRRRLFGRLRAIGVRDTEIGRLVLLEATVLAIVGTLLGTLLGYWLGQGLTRIVAATVSELYYQVSADAAQLHPASLAKAWALGIAGTWFAAWLPARQAARPPPLTTLSRAALERDTRRRIPLMAWMGSVLLVLGLVAALSLPGGVITGFAGLFVLLIGAALLTPAAVRLAHLVLDRLAPTGVWRLAVRDLDRHLSRLSTATAALMVALAASVGVAVMVDSMRGAVSDWLQDLLNADLYVAAPGFADGASLPAAVVAEARRLPQVRAYSSYRNIELPHDGAPLRLIAAELAAPSRIGFELIAADGPEPWGSFDRGAILISEPLAYRLSLRPGDSLPLLTDNGERPFAVAAVFRDFASEHGRLFIARDHYSRHWDDPEVDTLALFAAARDAGALLSAANERLAADHELVFTPAAGIYDESMAIFDRTFRITEVLRLLSLSVAFIGVLSALMALQLERRKEYAILRALGLTRLQVSRLIVIESGLLGLIAALLAIPVGLAMAWILTAAIQLRAFGWSMPLTLSEGPLLTALITGLFAALLASLYPAWRSAQQHPAPQLRED